MVFCSQWQIRGMICDSLNFSPADCIRGRHPNNLELPRMTGYAVSVNQTPFSLFVLLIEYHQYAWRYFKGHVLASLWWAVQGGFVEWWQTWWGPLRHLGKCREWLRLLWEEDMAESSIHLLLKGEAFASPSICFKILRYTEGQESPDRIPTPPVHSLGNYLM